jgi:hypothetical protein
MVLSNMKLVANHPLHGILSNTHYCNHYQLTYTSYYNAIIWFNNAVELGMPMYITKLCLDNVGMILFGYNVRLNSSVLGVANIEMLPINAQHVAKLITWGQFLHNPRRTLCPTQEVQGLLYIALWNMVKKI